MHPRPFQHLGLADLLVSGVLVVRLRLDVVLLGIGEGAQEAFELGVEAAAVLFLDEVVGGSGAAVFEGV
jgi:hypothetical protein